MPSSRRPRPASPAAKAKASPKAAPKARSKAAAKPAPKAAPKASPKPKAKVKAKAKPAAAPKPAASKPAVRKAAAPKTAARTPARKATAAAPRTSQPKATRKAPARPPVAAAPVFAPAAPPVPAAPPAPAAPVAPAATFVQAPAAPEAQAPVGPLSSEELLARVVALVRERRGEEIVALDVRGLADYMDYLVICTGRSERQNRAIADGLMRGLRGLKVRPVQRPGPEEGLWICLDFVDVVVHIFDGATRAHYDLENLWGDAPKVALPPAAPAPTSPL